MFIDSHCHLDRLKLDDYQGSLDALMDTTRQAGVSKILCVGVDHANASRCVELAEQYEDVVASVGIHPLDCKEQIPDMALFEPYLHHPKVVALGETGLDYHYSKETRSLQQDAFVQHLTLAKSSGLPVIIHTREAKNDTLQLMKEYGCEQHTGVLHCFTESWDMAKKALDMNYYISISGIVTFRNASDLRDVVKKLPLDRLLVETDSPYLAPVPYRGRSNEPRFVVEVGHYVAELLGVEVETLAKVTSENFYRLFGKA